MNWTGDTAQLVSATAGVIAVIWLADMLLDWLAGIILNLFDGADDVD